MWKSNFDQVIDMLKIHQEHKADAHYFYIQDRNQYLDLPHRAYITIPLAYDYDIGDLYIKLFVKFKR